LKTLSFHYRDADGERTARTIVPFIIVKGHSDGVAYIHAICTLRQDIRSFRSDRMSNVHIGTVDSNDVCIPPVAAVKIAHMTNGMCGIRLWEAEWVNTGNSPCRYCSSIGGSCAQEGCVALSGKRGGA